MKSNYKFLFLLLSLGINYAFAQIDKSISNSITIIPHHKGNEMLHQCSRTVPIKVDSFFNLKQTYIQNLEDNFNKIKSIRTTNSFQTGTIILKLKEYKFQVIGIIINSKKYIYINAFHVENQDFPNWRKIPIVVCDGGIQFWGAIFDIENKTISQVSTNGEG